MYKSRLLKYGAILVTGSFAVYNRKDISNASVGVLRIGRAALTAGEIVVDYNNLYSKKWDPNSEEYNKAASAVHLRSAQRLLRLCEANGGVFIKVGQHLGALDYLIPFEYVQTMRVLHSHAPPTKFSEILAVIKQDLKCDPLSIFQLIEETPLGTASLAQVHRAKLLDGTVVAVKVQHPLVKAYSKVDIRSMEFLVDIVSWIFPDFKLQWLVDETKINLPRELNFKMEGRNSEKTAALMKHLPWLHVPKVYWELTTSRVLTMEYCQGLNIGDLSQEKNSKLQTHKREISQKITQLYSDMIFLHGYIHCDPHPGNIKVDLNERGQLIIHLLDHGLYSQIPSDFQEKYSKFWMSIIRSNVQEMQLYAEQLGVGEMYGLFACMISGRSWNAILGGIDKNKKSASEAKEIKEDASKYVVEIMEVLHRMPREMLLILKTNDLLRGLDSLMGIKDNMASFVTMARSCAYARYIKDLNECNSLPSKLCASLSHYISHFKITVYEIFLCWVSWWTQNNEQIN